MNDETLKIMMTCSIAIAALVAVAVVTWKLARRGQSLQRQQNQPGQNPGGSAGGATGGGAAAGNQPPAAATPPTPRGPSPWPRVISTLIVVIPIVLLIWLWARPIGTKLDRWAVSPPQVEKVERLNPEEQAASNNRLNQHIISCLTGSYGLPKKGVEDLLGATGSVPGQKFREELFYKFGVKAPLNWEHLPRWPRAVPIGTTVEYTFTLKPGETSQVFAMLGVWVITIEPTDRSMSMDLDYILDPGQPYGKTVQYRPLPTKQNRYLDPATGKEVDGAARNTYQVALPQGYALPTGKDGVEFKVIMVRERNPDFNE